MEDGTKLWRATASNEERRARRTIESSTDDGTAGWAGGAAEPRANRERRCQSDWFAPLRHRRMARMHSCTFVPSHTAVLSSHASHPPDQRQQ